MARKFIFIKDVEAILKQGKTEMQLPEGSRFSPAAWDLVRENNIQVSFAGQPSVTDDESKDSKIQARSSPREDISGQLHLIAVVSSGRAVAGSVGENAASSPYYLIFDHDGKFIDIVKNPAIEQRNDTEKMIVRLLNASQVSAIVAQQFSDAFRSRLAENNIQYFEISGPIEEAVKIVLNKGGDKSVPQDNNHSTITD